MEPRMPTSVADVEAMSWSDMKFVFAITFAQAGFAFVDHGDNALRTKIGAMELEARATVARGLAEVA